MDPGMSDPDVSHAERYPTLSEHGQSMLRFLQEHPHAPIYRNQSGNRLTIDEVARVRVFEKDVRAARVGWEPQTEPPWLRAFIEEGFATVPFYRNYQLDPRRVSLGELPTISRADLSHDIAAFVPDSVPTERLINFRTSGTTGHPLLLASHPIVAANYLAFHKRALDRFGIELRYGRNQVGVVLVGYQRKCFTYVSVTPTMDDSGLAKINLHPADWRDLDDRAKYLDALNPEVYTGDPLSFSQLVRLPLTTRPRVLLSTSMTLLPGLKAELEERFACPVLDLYSMNEAGPVAVADASAGGHVVLQDRLFVEILDPSGARVPLGQRGEITLTGGFNFCLPLLRYRTGDYASLAFHRGEPVLIGLEGRPPVMFRTRTGDWINNIEVTHALQQYAIPQYTLHQQADGGLRLRWVQHGVDLAAVRRSLESLFGPGQAIAIEELDGFEGKVVQYTTALSFP